MKCPSCPSSPLHLTDLASHLKASSCFSCKGKWIAASDYWTWLDRQGEALPEKTPDDIPLQVADTQKAKLCPRCQRIMLRYRVGHGLDFRLDQCGHCKGIWFDANEWEALAQRNLHDEVHLIFSAPWQSKIRKAEARQMLDTIYENSFQADYDKVKQIKAWLDTHPEKKRIIDYLNNPDPYAIRS